MSLVERNEELAALEDVFTMLTQRVSGKVVMVTGGMATGKTTLLRVFADRAAESGALVLSAVASRVERNLPFGVLEQLFRSPGLPRASAERAMRWLGTGCGQDPAGGAEQISLPVLRGLWEVLRDLAEHQPVVIGVDDVHYADEASLRCLLYLLRRLRWARLHVIFSECSHLKVGNALLQSEFLREPFFRHIRLEPLSKEGVGDMLARRLDEQTAQALAPVFREASAGYPLLVQALIDDYRANPGGAPGALIAGEAFDRAVLNFLYRYGPPIMDVARAIALLGEHTSTSLLGRLLDMDADEMGQAVNTLTIAGLLENGHFRHDAIKTAVLNGTPPNTRMATHGRAAVLLRNEGVAATEVAAHIVAAGHMKAPWVIPILQEAAEHALAYDDVATSLRYLRIAYQMCDDEQWRPSIVSALADVEWRVDPSTVLRHLHELSGFVRAEAMVGQDALAPITYLLWHGRVGEALGMVDGFARNQEAAAGTGTGTEAATTMDLDTPRLWGAYIFPGYFRDRYGIRPGPGRHEYGSAELVPELQGATVLAAELTHGNQNDALAAAEEILQRCRLNHRTLAPLTAAVAVLTYNEQLEQAAAWCDALLEEAVARHSPTWQALFAAERALISIRQGKLVAAEKHANTALHVLSPKSWSVVVGLPLAAMVLATTSMGNLEHAATFLDIPVPEAMFKTRMGVHFLYARGRHHLLANRAHAALSDFRFCGRLMKSWGIDLPTVEPWRTGAAQAYLVLGDARTARRLMDEQLALLRPEQLRLRGMSLRVKAATYDLESRPVLLKDAVNLLQHCGDQLELAYTLADQAQVSQLLGRNEQARTLRRKARTLAQRCGTRVLEQTQTCGNPDEGFIGPNWRSLPSGLITDLSDAERRVAALAADGCTNREISERLYITVSTVEQHLTKIYRKLNVKRFDLQSALQLYAPGPGGSGSGGREAPGPGAAALGRSGKGRRGPGHGLAACYGLDRRRTLPCRCLCHVDVFTMSVSPPSLRATSGSAAKGRSAKDMSMTSVSTGS